MGAGQQNALAQAQAQQQALANAYNNASNQGIYTSTSSGTTSVWITGATTSTTTTLTQGQAVGLMHGLATDIRINDGRAHRIHFPDGTIIDIKANGSFEIQDQDAKVVYKANRSRDFNPFINASDKLEAFIKFCGEAGVRQGEVLDIPIKHFIGWLIVESAKADGEPEPDVLLLPDLRAKAPRCLICARFISPVLKSNKVEFCRPVCFETKLRRTLALPRPHQNSEAK